MTSRTSAEEVAVRSGDDVIRARRVVREVARAAGLSLVDQTKLVTAASELARNALIHGGSGMVRVEVVTEGRRSGIRAVFSDDGPGIADVPLAMTDGYTTGSGLGLGLGGSRRLVDEFHLESGVGRGTTVTVVKWSR